MHHGTGPGSNSSSSSSSSSHHKKKKKDKKKKDKERKKADALKQKTKLEAAEAKRRTQDAAKEQKALEKSMQKQQQLDAKFGEANLKVANQFYPKALDVKNRLEGCSRDQLFVSLPPNVRNANFSLLNDLTNAVADMDAVCNGNPGRAINNMGNAKDAKKFIAEASRRVDNLLQLMAMTTKAS